MRSITLLLLCFAALAVADEGREVLPVTGEELVNIINNQQETVVVVNFWATWCQPCVEEFPELLEFAEEYSDRSVKLILVSADFDDQMEKLHQFLDKHGVDFTTYIKTGDDMEFIDTFAEVNWRGALPLTIVYNSERIPVASFNRQITKADLTEAVDKLLN